MEENASSCQCTYSEGAGAILGLLGGQERPDALRRVVEGGIGHRQCGGAVLPARGGDQVMLVTPLRDQPKLRLVVAGDALAARTLLDAVAEGARAGADV